MIASKMTVSFSYLATEISLVVDFMSKYTVGNTRSNKTKILSAMTFFLDDPRQSVACSHSSANPILMSIARKKSAVSL